MNVRNERLNCYNFFYNQICVKINFREKQAHPIMLTYHKNGYLKIGTVFMCIGIFVLFSSFDFNRVSKKINNTVSFISKRTLDIYYIHMFFAAIALDYIYPKVQVANVLINSVRTLIIIIIALVIGQFFRKLPVLKHLLNA